MTGWVVWAGTLGFRTPVLERLAAARHLDVSRFSVSSLDVEAAARAGIDAAELGRRIRDAGYDVVMDPIVGWYAGTQRAESTFARFSADETLRVSEALGVVSINAIAQPASTASHDAIVTEFAALCDRAAGFGAQVHLEFTPITEIDDLAAGWRVARDADRPNGGLLFDTWHFYRSVADLDLLASIPGERIFAVQVADAAAERRADIRDDTLNRLLPGDGVFDLVTVLSVLHRIGALSWIGPEVIAPELAADPINAARIADERTRAVVAEAIRLAT